MGGHLFEVCCFDSEASSARPRYSAVRGLALGGPASEGRGTEQLPYGLSSPWLTGDTATGCFRSAGGLLGSDRCRLESAAWLCKGVAVVTARLVFDWSIEDSGDKWPRRWCSARLADGDRAEGRTPDLTPTEEG